MLTPPLSPTTEQVLAAVRASWNPEIDTATYLPVGFGAQHWRLDRCGTPWGFATVDADTRWRPLRETIAAYAAAQRLQDAGVPGVVAPLTARGGAPLVPLGTDGLSVTPWLDGRTPTEAEALAGARRTVDLLEGLHHAEVLDGPPRWTTRVPADVGVLIDAGTTPRWSSGPYAEPARRSLRSRISAIETWAARHRELVARAESTARTEPWVPTHGEPHHANQMLTDAGLVLVDWESARTAPSERDLLDIPDDLREELGARPWAIELFELEWRLTEIVEYLDRFRGPHSGSADDDAAFEGLQEELGAAG